MEANKNVLIYLPIETETGKFKGNIFSGVKKRINVCLQIPYDRAV